MGEPETTGKLNRCDLDELGIKIPSAEQVQNSESVIRKQVIELMKKVETSLSRVEYNADVAELFGVATNQYVLVPVGFASAEAIKAVRDMLVEEYGYSVLVIGEYAPANMAISWDSEVRMATADSVEPCKYVCSSEDERLCVGHCASWHAWDSRCKARYRRLSELRTQGEVISLHECPTIAQKS